MVLTVNNGVRNWLTDPRVEVPSGGHLDWTSDSEAADWLQGNAAADSEFDQAKSLQQALKKFAGT